MSIGSLNNHPPRCPCVSHRTHLNIFVLLLIVPHHRGLRIQWTLVVRLAQQRLDGQQNGAHIVQRRPLVLQYVQTDGALQIDVGMKAGCQELDHGRRIRVRVGEVQRQPVRLPSVHGIQGTGNGADPLEDVLAVGECRDALLVGHHQIHQFLVQSAGL